MKQMTVTEALAERATIAKRIQKKMTAIGPYLAKLEKTKDPLEGDGGSKKYVAETRQSILDLAYRSTVITRLIAESNQLVNVTVSGVERTIAEWLIWRRETAPLLQTHFETMRRHVSALRDEASRKTVGLRETEGGQPDDIVVMFSETELNGEIENLEQVLGDLDGRLSLSNATTLIEVPD